MSSSIRISPEGNRHETPIGHRPVKSLKAPVQRLGVLFRGLEPVGANFQRPPPRLSEIGAWLGSNLLVLGFCRELVEPMADPPPRTSVTVERIAVASVIGTLVSRSGYLDAASGLSSNAEIKSSAEPGALY